MSIWGEGTIISDGCLFSAYPHVRGILRTHFSIPGSIGKVSSESDGGVTGRYSVPTLLAVQIAQSPSWHPRSSTGSGAEIAKKQAHRRHRPAFSEIQPWPMSEDLLCVAFHNSGTTVAAHALCFPVSRCPKFQERHSRLANDADLCASAKLEMTSGSELYCEHRQPGSDRHMLVPQVSHTGVMASE
ncbi:hypothetical protein VTK56DRAFT_2546 [Thermocarpiscus australiensis]